MSHPTSDQKARRPKYRMHWLPDLIDPSKGQRVKVVFWRRVPGHEVRFTDICTGCSDVGDYGTVYGPVGCEECGYTGKRRRVEWVPFDFERYDRTLKRFMAEEKAKEAAHA